MFVWVGQGAGEKKNGMIYAHVSDFKKMCMYICIHHVVTTCWMLNGIIICLKFIKLPSGFSRCNAAFQSCCASHYHITFLIIKSQLLLRTQVRMSDLLQFTTGDLRNMKSIGPHMKTLTRDFDTQVRYRIGHSKLTGC